MTRTKFVIPAIVAAIACTALASAHSAQSSQPSQPSQPAQTSLRLSNAQIRPVDVAGAGAAALAARVKTIVEAQVEPAWIAYEQPIVDNSLGGCCWGSGSNWSDDDRSGCCGGCPLDDRRETAATPGRGEGSSRPGPIKLEGSSAFVVLLRAEQRRIDRVRVYSADCDLDAGGRVVHLVTGVRAADSVSLLESLATQWATQTRKAGPETIVMGIAFHRDPAADASLARLLAPLQTESLRRKALFWMARARGRPGFEAVRTVMREDPDVRLRKEAVFALTQSREPDVVPVLIDAARTNPVAEARGQALFWLAQKAGREADAAISRAVREDPDTQVKERAVFALSQLPKERGIPLLIEVAKTNANPQVRKRAMFWLGQSKDPRAIDFFESVLR